MRKADVMTADPLWPRYAEPADLAVIEAIPLEDRGLPASTYDLLAKSAARWPLRPALSVLPDGARWDQPVERTFADLLGDVHQYANLLRHLGVGRTDAVALIAPNCDGLITATLAAQLAGIAAPINGGLSAEHITELVRRSGARVLITASENLDPTAWPVATHLAAAGLIDTVLLIGPTGTAGQGAPPLPGAAVHVLDRAASVHNRASFNGEAPTATDLAALFHTGGTTGTPKLAAHTHANEVADAWMIAANSIFDHDSVIFTALPLFHVNALMVTLLAPLLRGQRSVWAGPRGYRDTDVHANFWRIVERYSVSAMSAVPTVYALLSRIPVNADISSMKAAIVGASPLPPAVRRDFESHAGVPLIEGYGLTEATCASVRSFPRHTRPGSAGQRMPYQRIKIVDIGENGAWGEVPAGTVGTLVISGPTVFAGYVTAHTDNGFELDGAGKVVDGWLDTGDLARIDEEGYLYLCGRSKDLIIRGGHNIDPAMIEDALLAHPDVTAAAAVGRPDVHSGEVPVAFVTLRVGATTTGRELKVWAAGQVAEAAAAPKSVVIVDAIPLTAIGKPFKLPLRAAAAREAISSALEDIEGVHNVRADTEDGSTVLTVTVEPGADRSEVEAVVNRYAVNCRIVDIQAMP